MNTLKQIKIVLIHELFTNKKWASSYFLHLRTHRDNFNEQKMKTTERKIQFIITLRRFIEHFLVIFIHDKIKLKNIYNVYPPPLHRVKVLKWWNQRLQGRSSSDCPLYVLIFCFSFQSFYNNI